MVRPVTAIPQSLIPTSVLVRVSVTVKTHHSYGNSYKGKHLIGSSLQFQRFSQLSLWWGAWWHAGKHGAGYNLIRRQHKVDFHTGQYLEHTGDPKDHVHSGTLPPSRLHLLQQGHYFLTATPFGGYFLSNHHAFFNTETTSALVSGLLKILLSQSPISQ